MISLTDPAGSSLHAAKTQLRARAQERRAEFYNPQLGRNVAESFLALPALHEAQNVVAFASMGTEMDLYPLMRILDQMGRHLFLPRMEQGGGLSFRRFVPGDPLIVNCWGIAEPSKTRPEWVPQAGDFLLCPGLAFDKAGGRLGYGGGYYDRVLKMLGEQDFFVRTLGVGFAVQWDLGVVPMGSSDQRVQGFLHEEGAGFWT